MDRRVHRDPCHITDLKKEASGESNVDTWTPHGYEGPQGPKLTQVLTSIDNTPKGPHVSQLEEGGTSRAHRGSFELT
jgi:hypothetical protein